MKSPSVTVLLNGYLMPSDQGNPAFCGAYLIEGPDGDGGLTRAVYDCGHIGRRRRLLAALAGCGLEPADVDIVVLSHGHWDHIQNVDLFSRARILMHAEELRYLDAPLPADLGTPRWSKAILASLNVSTTGEGDSIMPGVSVVELPGHTRGSIGLVVATGAGTAVLTGDAVATADVLRSGQCLGVPFDPEKAAVAVTRVAGLADTVYPGHDRPFVVNGETPAGYLTTAVPITFRVPDPVAMRDSLTFTRYEPRPNGVR